MGHSFLGCLWPEQPQSGAQGPFNAPLEMEATQELYTCPLCDNPGTELYHKDNTREYYCCSRCMLVFVPSRYHLSTVDEKAVYDLHENNPEDPGYRKFLSRLTTPLLERLPSNCQGLDFGCGPGPAIAKLLLEHPEKVTRVQCFDPHYCNELSLLDSSYDFICATEVVEHLRQPKKEFDLLFSMLNPNGWLAIMTKLVRNSVAFSSWHYIRDMTHISFFSQPTFKYLAKSYNADLTFVADDAILLQKRQKVR